MSHVQYFIKKCESNRSCSGINCKRTQTKHDCKNAEQIEIPKCTYFGTEKNIRANIAYMFVSKG